MSNVEVPFNPRASSSGNSKFSIGYSIFNAPTRQREYPVKKNANTFAGFAVLSKAKGCVR